MFVALVFLKRVYHLRYFFKNCMHVPTENGDGSGVGNNIYLFRTW